MNILFPTSGNAAAAKRRFSPHFRTLCVIIFAGVIGFGGLSGCKPAPSAPSGAGSPPPTPDSEREPAAPSVRAAEETPPAGNPARAPIAVEAIIPPGLEEVPASALEPVSYFGVSFMERNVAKELEEHRVAVLGVEPGSPGEVAGLLPGDILLTLNGNAVNDWDAFLKSPTWRGAKPGDALILRVQRGTEVRDITFTVGAATPDRKFRAAQYALSLKPVGNYGFAFHETAGGKEIYDVAKDGPGEKAGLRKGDMLRAIGGLSKNLQSELEAVAAGQTIQVEFERDGKRQSTALTLDYYPSEKNDEPYQYLDPGLHSGPIQHILHSPVRELLVSIDDQGVIKFWRSSDLALQATLPLPTGFGKVSAASLSRDGRMLVIKAAWGMRRSCFVIDVERREIAAFLPTDIAATTHDFTNVSISPDARFVICAQNMRDDAVHPEGIGHLWLFDLAAAGVLDATTTTAEQRPPVFVKGRRIATVDWVITGLGFSPRNTRFATSEWGGFVKMWDAAAIAAADEAARLEPVATFSVFNDVPPFAHFTAAVTPDEFREAWPDGIRLGRLIWADRGEALAVCTVNSSNNPGDYAYILDDGLKLRDIGSGTGALALSPGGTFLWSGWDAGRDAYLYISGVQTNRDLSFRLWPFEYAMGNTDTGDKHQLVYKICKHLGVAWFGIPPNEITATDAESEAAQEAAKKANFEGDTYEEISKPIHRKAEFRRGIEVLKEFGPAIRAQARKFNSKFQDDFTLLEKGLKDRWTPAKPVPAGFGGSNPFTNIAMILAQTKYSDGLGYPKGGFADSSWEPANLSRSVANYLETTLGDNSSILVSEQTRPNARCAVALDEGSIVVPAKNGLSLLRVRLKPPAEVELPMLAGRLSDPAFMSAADKSWPGDRVVTATHPVGAVSGGSSGVGQVKLEECLFDPKTGRYWFKSNTGEGALSTDLRSASAQWERNIPDGLRTSHETPRYCNTPGIGLYRSIGYFWAPRKTDTERPEREAMLDRQHPDFPALLARMNAALGRINSGEERIRKEERRRPSHEETRDLVQGVLKEFGLDREPPGVVWVTGPNRVRFELSTLLSNNPLERVFHRELAREIGVFEPRTGEYRYLVKHTGRTYPGDFIISPDDKLFLYEDGIGRIKILDVGTGNLLATLVAFQDGAWFLSAPGGFFDSHPEATRRVGWRMNQNLGRLPKLYSSDQLVEYFQRRDLIAESLRTGRPADDLAREHGLKFELGAVLRGVPVVEIAGVRDGQEVGVSRLDVVVKATDVGGGVQDVQLFHNGKRIPADGPGRSRGTVLQEKTFSVLLTPGENSLRAVASNRNKVQSAPANATLRFNGVKAQATLRVLTASLNRYQNPRYNLNCCLADASAMAAALSARGGGLFKEVIVREMKDQEVTRASLAEAFEKIAAEAEPQDMFVFMFAGHGTMSQPEVGEDPVFYLVPHDVTRLYGDQDQLVEKAISAKQLEDWSAKVPAQKQILLLDTCQSGGMVDTFAMRGAAEERAITQLARATGTAVLASTGTEQYATEFKELGHGVFTYALLQALEKGEGDANKDGKVTIKELEAYVNDKVPELTQKYQGTAQYPNSYSRGQDFPIGLTK